MRRPSAAFAAAILFAACAAAPDEAWLRVTGIRTGQGDSSQSITVLESKLRDGKADTVDIDLENLTSVLGTSGDGVGIAVYFARVEYELAGYDFPVYQYPLTLYLAPPASTVGDGDAVTSVSVRGTIEDLPVATVELKGWIMNPERFPPDLLRAPVRLAALITIRARTDEGRELETEASLTVVFDTGRIEESQTPDEPPAEEE